MLNASQQEVQITLVALQAGSSHGTVQLHLGYIFSNHLLSHVDLCETRVESYALRKVRS